MSINSIDKKMRSQNPAQGYAKPAYIAIDIGGTKIAAAIVDKGGRILWRTKAPTNRMSEDALLHQLSQTIGMALSFLHTSSNGISIAGIGIGIPGSVDREKGIAISAVNLPWNNTPIKTFIEREYSIPVYLENDANAGALGELWYGRGREVKNFMYVAIGTGIGGGLVVNKSLYRGTGKAGEVGHLIIDKGGPICKCGTRGCLEALASAPAIAVRAEKLLVTGIPTLITSFLGEDKSLTAEAVTQAAQVQDKLAVNIISDVTKDLGVAFINVFRLLDPDLIIIGGGVASAGQLFLTAIRQGMIELNKDFARYANRIVLSDLGADCGLLGAAAIVRNECSCSLPSREPRVG